MSTYFSAFWHPHEGVYPCTNLVSLSSPVSLPLLHSVAATILHFSSSHDISQKFGISFPDNEKGGEDTATRGGESKPEREHTIKKLEFQPYRYSMGDVVNIRLKVFIYLPVIFLALILCWVNIVAQVHFFSFNPSSLGNEPLTIWSAARSASHLSDRGPISALRISIERQPWSVQSRNCSRASSHLRALLAECHAQCILDLYVVSRHAFFHTNH